MDAGETDAVVLEMVERRLGELLYAEPECPAQVAVGVHAGNEGTWYAAIPVSGLEGHEGQGFSVLLDGLPEDALVCAFMRDGGGL